MSIDKNLKMTHSEWMKYISDNINVPAKSYQEKVETKIEKKNENPSKKGKWS